MLRSLRAVQPGRLATLAATLLGVACARPPSPAQPDAPQPVAPRPASGHTSEPTSLAKAEPAATGPRSGEGSTSEPPPPSRPQLTLPADPAFVHAPLPPATEGGYASWRETRRIDVGQSHLTEVDRLPSGRLVTFSQAEGKVRLYEQSPQRLVGSHEVTGFQKFDPVALVAWPSSPDRYVQGSEAGLGVYSTESGERVGTADARPVWGLRWSADGGILMALGSGRTAEGSVLRFYARGDDSSLEPLGELDFEQRVDAWDLSRDARLLALVEYPSNTIRVLDLHERGAVVYHGHAPRYAGDVAFSPDGRFLAVGGDGLLVIDLPRPDRVAFYSYVKNNMGHVRFSPSGDAIFASAYDGQIRIFGLTVADSGQLELALLRTLSHAGQANVYAFAFSPDGRELVSSSGDRTLRTFAGRAGARTEAAEERRFRDLTAWRQRLGSESAPTTPRPEAGRAEFRLDSELGPVRPSRIVPGHYACKITLIYRLRDCWVRRDAAGRTWLEFAPDNLLHVAGVLWDDGPAVRFEAKLVSPSTVVDCPGCERQALHGVFRGQAGKYTGVLTFRQYYDPLVPPPLPPLDIKREEASDRYPLVLEYRGPLEAEQ